MVGVGNEERDSQVPAHVSAPPPSEDQIMDEFAPIPRLSLGLGLKPLHSGLGWLVGKVISK